MPLLRLFVYTIVLGLACSFAAAAAFHITLPASDQNRAGIVVSFPLPANAPANAELRDPSGPSVPLQVDADRQARFVIASAQAGGTPTFTLAAAPLQAAAAVTAQPPLTGSG